MHDLTLRQYTICERPDLQSLVDEADSTAWPEFMHHDPVANRYWGALYTDFPEFQIALCDGEDHLVAVGHAAPFPWDGSEERLPGGWDAVLERAVLSHQRGETPTALAGLSIVVSPEYRGRNVSRLAVQAMVTVAESHGLLGPVIPVRPTLKCKYPLTPMGHYIGWKQGDGSPFDPWLRVHWRLGARILRPAPDSMVITGTVEEWELWAGMRFPESGEYVVPGALSLVVIDRENDRGEYREPNAWMMHRPGPDCMR